jgi:hypothetical protein
LLKKWEGLVKKEKVGGVGGQVVKRILVCQLFDCHMRGESKCDFRGARHATNSD